MEHTRFENIEISQTERKQIAYTDEFKNWIQDHPGTIKAFKQLETELAAQDPESGWEINLSVETEGATLTLVHYFVRGKIYIFKVEAGDKTYCVKKAAEPSEASEHPPVGHDAFNEIKALAEAKELLKNVEGVEVADFHFAFRDSQGNNYLVLRWYELTQVEVFLADSEEGGSLLQSKKSTELAKSIRKRIRIIRDTLKDFYDVKTHNMFYDPDRDKVIVFDLHKLQKPPQ
jgi:hypothetical protein